MNIGKKIYMLRKEKNITQEQLAKAIGISTPAVSKWETGTTMPDITLIAPIARFFQVSIDELFSFKSELTQKEADKLLEDVREVCKNNGFRNGMEKGFELLKQYPNSDYLKLEIAMDAQMLAFTVTEDYSEEEYEDILKRTTKLLEELMYSEDADIRMAATYCVAIRYMIQKRLDEAEVLLEKLPKKQYNGEYILPSVFLSKGEYDKSLQAAERNLLQDYQHMLSDIQTLHKVACKQKNYEMALKYAQGYYSIANTIGYTLDCSSQLMLDTYVLMEDNNKAEECFCRYIDEIINISSDYSKSIYFKDIADNIVTATTDVCDDIRTSYYKALILNPGYEKLKNSEMGKACLKRLERVLSE